MGTEGRREGERAVLREKIPVRKRGRARKGTERGGNIQKEKEREMGRGPQARTRHLITR